MKNIELNLSIGKGKKRILLHAGCMDIRQHVNFIRLGNVIVGFFIAQGQPGIKERQPSFAS